MGSQERKSDQSRNKIRVFLWMVAAACVAFAGCSHQMGPITLKHAVLAYDSNALNSQQNLLLLNIVRMHDDQPPHFTVSNDIKATFKVSATATMKAGAESEVNNKGLFGLELSATGEENPTITISPMESKEFAQRLLKPMDIAVANMVLLQKGRNIDKLLRLTSHSFLMLSKKKTEETLKADYPKEVIAYLKDCFREEEKEPCLEEDCFLVNSPPKEGERKTAWGEKEMKKYILFRQVVLHIKASELSGRGRFFPLSFEIPIIGTERIAKDLSTKDFKDTIDAFEKQYRWESWEKKDKSDTEECGKARDGGGGLEPGRGAGQPAQPEIRQGFILTDNSNLGVEGTFTAADDLKGKEMKDIIAALEGKYHWEKSSKPGKKEEAFILNKRYTIIALTDFEMAKDLEMMCKEEKKSFLDKIFKDLELSNHMELDQSVVIVLFKGDKKKGSWPIYGLFRLRNFRQILQFLAESVNEKSGHEREVYVPPSQFTEDFLAAHNLQPVDNPPLTLSVTSGGTPPGDSVVHVVYKGQSFWVSSPPAETIKHSQWDKPRPPRWDKQVFGLLYEIFQMNRVEPAASPTFIAK